MKLSQGCGVLAAKAPLAGRVISLMRHEPGRKLGGAVNHTVVWMGKFHNINQR